MEFKTIWTNTGLLKLTQKVAAGQKLNITHAAVGDGGKDDGTGAYEPSMAQTALVREKYRAEIISATISDKDSHKIYFCFTIPAQVGGFYIHEAGLFDEDGDLIAISGVPMSYKAVADEGATNDLKLKIGTLFANTDQVKLEFNPSVSYVDFEDLEAAKQEVKDYADQQDAVISAAINSKIDTHANNTVVHITAAERDAWDAKATQDDLQQLAASSVVHYKGFAEVAADYTASTPLVDVVKAMADNSILFAVVGAANDDYPAAGNLQVIRYTDGRADCQLRSTDDDGKPTLWIASFTPSEIEQIFGGGGY